MSGGVRLATGPVSWGVDFADGPDNPPWGTVLDGIAAAGYEWAELGPTGYLPTDPAQLRPELERRGLQVAGTFVFEPLHEPALLDRILETTRRTCRLIRAMGGGFLVVIDRVEPERTATAGRSEDAPRLSLSRWAELVDGIEAVAAVARDEFGLRPVYHPHVGTWVEFEDEIDNLMDALDHDLIGLCIDTGHSAYAGMDPVALYERYAKRVEYLHLKDVDRDVLARAVSEPLGFWPAVAEAIFCPVGAGVVDFPEFALALARHGFDGPATVEQDRDPSQQSDPLADVVASRRYLESVAIAAPAKERMT